MVDAINVKFPITLEEFTRLQRAEIKRDFTAEELALFEDIAYCANSAFYAASRGDENVVADMLAAIEDGSAQDTDSVRIRALFRGWVLLAIEQVKECHRK